MIAANSKLGYYKVGNQYFESKIEALIAGTNANCHPTWHFNDQIWKSQNWTQEPETDILELYRIRARQIREQYDYIIMYYSGGSDSQTMLDAFIESGSFIDEIVTVWSRKHDNKFELSPSVTDARNIEAEFEFTTRPGLDRIKLLSPNTKITYTDVSDAVVENFKKFDGEEWLANTTEHLNPQMVTRWSTTRDIGNKKTLDRGIRTAALFGIDKPRVCIRDGKFSTYFIDVVVNPYRGGFNDVQYTNLETVLFYWAPDMPEIVIKQSHMIKKWFELNPRFKPLLTWPKNDWASRNAYETITRTIVYPNWDISNFQVLKTTSCVYCEWDDWFFKLYDKTRIYDNWAKGVEHVKNNIDPKYLQYLFGRKLQGFVGMITDHFALE